jgi:hypothetical protein
MSKIITIKLTVVNNDAGPFNIYDGAGNLIAENVLKKTLSGGVSYIVNNEVTLITITSIGKCKLSKTMSVSTITQFVYATTKTKTVITSCLWRHLTNVEDYNRFYGTIEPYIIEYPFSYKFQDEILQNVKDYTRAYKYLPSETGVFNYNTKVETNDQWFNKAILYNGQQSSGILNLVSKPLNNLSVHSQYPIFKEDSKTIVYTKSDNFYQYNSFWALQKSSQIPMFLTSCENLSIDKVVNISNMDYSSRSFKKAPLRAKELRVRHILDNTSSIHLVSQFILTPAQISYK